MTADDLTPPRYELLAELTHAQLGEFVIEYFFRRRSWLVWAHHAMSLATLVAIVFVALRQDRSFLRCLGDFALAFGVLFVVILPLHELLHAFGYRLVGARDIRWDYSMRMLAVWVIAHRFVAGTRAFVVVALAPFVVLNAVLMAGAVVFPAVAVWFLFVLLWHLHGVSTAVLSWPLDCARGLKRMNQSRPMKPALLLAVALLFTACASTDEFARTLPCGPNQDIEVLAGIIDPAAARESGERVMYVVEVANNSDRDLVVSSIRLEPRTQVEGLSGASRQFNEMIEHGKDHRFELVANGAWAPPLEPSARQPAARRVEFSAVVTLSNGDAYHCSFVGRWQQ